MSSAAILGPWGGSGGTAFDDGWSNGGVSKLTIYYKSAVLRALEVTYKNGTTIRHGGRPTTDGFTQTIDFSSGAMASDISVIVNSYSAFSGDPNRMGVVALGAIASTTLASFPSAITGTVFRPQILGFFGAAGDHVDRLGLYISNSIQG